MQVDDFIKKKENKKKISMVTCYDFSSAQMVEQTDVDCILVGDSVAMVMHGHPTTLSADIDMMSLHTKAVSRGTDKFIVSDLPFLSYRKGIVNTMDSVEKIMRSGACAVKLEGIVGHEKDISQIVGSGVPVMGHLGLMPQSFHQLGGYKVQGKNKKAQEQILEQALHLEDLGCFAIVLECVSASLASNITERLHIPTIGIGAGLNVDGQVLVWQDLLGMGMSAGPKFVKEFSEGREWITEGVNRFCHEVQTQEFPTEKESYL